MDSYHEANMELVEPEPTFGLWDEEWPVRTYRPQLPPARVAGTVVDSLLSEGCVVEGGRVVRSVLSPGVHVHRGAEVVESVLFEGVEVGPEAHVHRAVVDKEVNVPPGDVM